MRRRPVLASVPLAIAILAGATSAPRAQTVYRGMCDASAAVAIGPRHFVAGDDEINVLQIYEIGKPDPVGERDLNDFLETGKEDGEWLEADIEGSARVGQRIYWISSHGLDSKGDRFEGRYRLFATEIDTTRSVPAVRPLAGAPYRSLLADILNDPLFADLPLKEASERAPEKKKGFSIEGLAATPDGGLLIGLRNPRPKKIAIVIPLLNPEDVVLHGRKPLFSEALRLDLGGRGIRSIERVGDGYLIVAGPHGDSDDWDDDGPAFSLYSWAGGTSKPVRQSTVLEGHPEALLAWEDGNLFTLSDDGDERIGGKTCKKARIADKRFRSFRIRPERLSD